MAKNHRPVSPGELLLMRELAAFDIGTVKDYRATYHRDNLAGSLIRLCDEVEALWATTVPDDSTLELPPLALHPDIMRRLAAIEAQHGAPDPLAVLTPAVTALARHLDHGYEATYCPGWVSVAETGLRALGELVQAHMAQQEPKA